jgi:hypothetical protein
MNTFQDTGKYTFARNDIGDRDSGTNDADIREARTIPYTTNCPLCHREDDKGFYSSNAYAGPRFAQRVNILGKSHIPLPVVYRVFTESQLSDCSVNHEHTRITNIEPISFM